jgi:fucose 4-O-acetylase-like acetyltransferase
MSPSGNLQSVRGLACVLLVLYHVIGSLPTNGLRVADGELRWLSDSLSVIRMPLFAFIAGCAHALRAGSPDLLPMMRSKALRLLLPTLVVGTLFAVLQSWTPGANLKTRNWALLHIEPVGHYWFPMALFWVFLAVGALQSGRLLANAWSLSLFFLVAVLAYLQLQGSHFLALNGALYLLPFFLLGLLAQQGGWLSRARPLPLGLALALLAVPALLAMPVPSADMDRRTLPVLWAGLCLSALIVKTCPDLRLLQWLGGYSYAIFLFHVFFTAATRQVWQSIGIESLVVGCALGLVAGLIGPVVVQRCVNRAPWARPYFLGSRSASGRKPSPAASMA